MLYPLFLYASLYSFFVWLKVSSSFEDKEQTEEKKKSRKRNITWYNPPYNNGVETNIGKQFLIIIDTHFGKTRKDNLQKVLNRKTMKIGYSCSKNFSTIIKNNNEKILNKYSETERNKNHSKLDNKCNCREVSKCPLNGECKSTGLIYRAVVTEENTENSSQYIGSTEGQFKTRYNNHKSNFNNKHQKDSTALSKHIWKIKDKNKKPIVKWNIEKQCGIYKSGQKKCDICLSEKTELILSKRKVNEINILNSRSELMSACRHRRKFILGLQPKLLKRPGGRKPVPAMT